MAKMSWSEMLGQFFPLSGAAPREPPLQSEFKIELMAAGPKRACDETQSEKEHGCRLGNFVAAADWANAAIALSRIDAEVTCTTANWRQKCLNGEGVIPSAKGENTMAGIRVREAIDRIATATSNSGWRGGVTDGHVVIERSELIPDEERILHDQKAGTGERPGRDAQIKRISTTANVTPGATVSQTTNRTK